MTLDLTSVLWFLTVGLIAGWAAGELRKGEGFGLLGNAVVGIAGALLGAFLFEQFRIGVPGMPGMIGSVVTAFVGATVLLFVCDHIGLHA